MDNAIIRDYQKFHSSGVLPIPMDLKRIINACYLPKRGRKQKLEAALSIGEKGFYEIEENCFEAKVSISGVRRGFRRKG